MSYSEIYEKIGFKKEMERLEKQAYLGSEKEVRMLKLLGVKEDSDILEVGGGPGFFTKILLDNFSKCEVTSLDNDEKLLEYAYSNLNKEYGNRVSFIVDDITSASIPDNYYECVIARFVFQHLNNPISALKEIYRILKPGGKVIIIDIDSELWGLTYPKNNLIKALNDNLAKFQSNLNGNREIGRVLITLLKSLGFVNYDIEAVINHSDILGKDNFRYKINSNMINDSKLSKMLDEYNNFFNLSYSSIMQLKLFFYGEKPKEARKTKKDVVTEKINETNRKENEEISENK